MNIIVAMCKNRGIGKNGGIPWSVKEDMKFFRNKTIGNKNNAVIMGRKTYDSLNKKLPKRDNYVISSTYSPMKKDGVFIYNDIVTATSDAILKTPMYTDIWVIGGEQIYKWYLNANLVKDVYITNINLDVECDSYFPTLSSDFVKHHSGHMVMSKEHKILYNIDVYRNKCYNYTNPNDNKSELLKQLDKIDHFGVI